MAIRRHGAANGFWGQDAVTKENTGVDKPSRPQFLGYAVDQVGIYVNVDQPTTITVQVAHSNSLTADGNNPSVENPPTVWGELYYPNQANNVTMTMTASGTKVLILNDFAPGWVRLRSSNDVGCVAGWEAQGY